MTKVLGKALILCDFLYIYIYNVNKLMVLILLTILKFPFYHRYAVHINQFKCAEISKTRLKPEHVTCGRIEDFLYGVLQQVHMIVSLV
jgi:hypothetical protein